MTKLVRSTWLAASMLMMALVLAACGGNAATPTPGSGGQGPTATPTGGGSDFDAEAYFRGKTITIVVGSNPGGGTDTQARYYAAHWGRYIPGNPRITVTNLEDVAGANYVWDSNPDGLTIFFQSSSGISQQVSPNARYDLAKVRVIGAISDRSPVWMVTGDVPYQSYKDAMGKTQPVLRYAMAAGSPDTASGIALMPLVIANWLDLPLQVLSVAEDGTNDTLLMMERGEVNSIVKGGVWYQLPSLREGWIRDGRIKAFADLGAPNAPMRPNEESDVVAPNPWDDLTEEQRSQWQVFSFPETLVGKNMWVPPDTPQEVLDVLRKAFKDSLNDPAFSDDLEVLTGQPLPDTSLWGEDLEPVFHETSDNFKANSDIITAIRDEVFARYID